MGTPPFDAGQPATHAYQVTQVIRQGDRLNPVETLRSAELAVEDAIHWIEQQAGAALARGLQAVDAAATPGPAVAEGTEQAAGVQAASDAPAAAPLFGGQES